MNGQENHTVTMAEHLVGNLWFSLDAIPLIAGRLEPETLRLVAGGQVAQAYSEMCRLLRSESEQLSAGALESGLRKQGFDFDWLARLQGRISAESIDTLLSYVAEINNAADLRKIQMICGNASRQAQQTDARADEVASELLKNLAEANKSASNVEHISVGVRRVREQIQRMRDGTALMGARTGFAMLDHLFRMTDGDLIIVGGRPSQGKTSLWRQIFVSRAKQIVSDGDDGQVVMFSSDDTADKLILAMACCEANVDSTRIKRGIASAEEYERVEDAHSLIESLPICIDDTSSPAIESIYYRCAMMNAQKPVRLAGHDYMELIRHKKIESDLQKAEASARGVKGIGRTL